jgi:hypothetical protein
MDTIFEWVRYVWLIEWLASWDYLRTVLGEGRGKRAMKKVKETGRRRLQKEKI